ncbi:MAG: hypothetical protein K2Q09_06310 [Phycisphaerales bacterium]|nr:hypothetical protein [Phycisphaerales bacterium]
MSNLRLVDDNGVTLPTDRLPFPTEAVRQMARQRIERISTRVKPSVTGPTPEGFEQLTRELEQRLAQAEEQLRSLRHQVDSYPFAQAKGNAGGGDRAA